MLLEARTGVALAAVHRETPAGERQASGRESLRFVLRNNWFHYSACSLLFLPALFRPEYGLIAVI